MRITRHRDKQNVAAVQPDVACSLPFLTLYFLLPQLEVLIKHSRVTVNVLDVSSTLDAETEPTRKRTKLSAEENFHRDDPQIGVCLECLKYEFVKLFSFFSPAASKRQLSNVKHD